MKQTTEILPGLVFNNCRFELPLDYAQPEKKTGVFARIVSAAGKEKAKVCAACHGETGATPIADNPKLAGQYYEYLFRALSDYKTGVRKNPVMSGMVAALKREDMADLAAYFSSQQALSVKY